MRLSQRIIKKIKRDTILYFLLQRIAYLVLRFLFVTYRLEINSSLHMRSALPTHPGIFYFWHQQTICGMFFFFKAQSTGSCIVSPSKDGKVAGFICRKLGFNVLYGSGYKNTISLTRQVLTILRQSRRLCLVGDGSRGPAFTLQKGLEQLARRAQVPLIFVECASTRFLTLSKSWDLFQIPLPFSKIKITVHEPLWLQNEGE